MNCFNVVSKGPKIRAVGGEISFYKNYVIHQFKTTGITDTFLPYSDIELEYLVIAGGGGGGGNKGAGGGAGGYRCSVPNEYSGGLSDPEDKLTILKKVSKDVIIGEGGTYLLSDGSVPESKRGTNGYNTTFDSIVSIGGGCGAGGGVATGRGQGDTGGSGGGSTTYYTSHGIVSGGLGTTNQGFNAGSAYSSVNATFTATGGGGAGGSSPNLTTSNRYDGVGGVGIESSITGFPLFRAAGGSSDVCSIKSSDIGGTYNSDPLQNTGSGGGANRKGADGIVIVRYRN